jgi:DUF2935 family protein
MKARVAADMYVYSRKGDQGELELPYEKPVIAPRTDDKDPARHAWADARFATDIMAEHALFFALLMPQELAAKERGEALRFNQTFSQLFQQIDADAPPDRSGVKAFVAKVNEQIKPFIAYKARLGDAQRAGQLRSLVWPLFFDHTRNEAERWTRRLELLAKGEPELDRSEVVGFWSNIMEEHARFVAHLLDPDEYKLIEEAYKASRVFQNLERDSLAGAAGAIAREPRTVAKSLVQNP